MADFDIEAYLEEQVSKTKESRFVGVQSHNYQTTASQSEILFFHTLKIVYLNPSF